MAEGGPLSDHQQARADLIRAQLAYVTGRGSDAPPLLLKAAQRLEPIDAALSRTTYLRGAAGGDLRRPIGAGRRGPGCGPRGAGVAAADDSYAHRPSARRPLGVLHRRIRGGPADLAPCRQRRAPRTSPDRRAALSVVGRHRRVARLG